PAGRAGGAAQGRGDHGARRGLSGGPGGWLLGRYHRNLRPVAGGPPIHALVEICDSKETGRRLGQSADSREKVGRRVAFHGTPEPRRFRFLEQIAPSCRPSALSSSSTGTRAPNMNARSSKARAVNSLMPKR